MLINNISQLQEVVKLVEKKANKNVCFLLNGSMGAGKTTFTKVLLASLGVKEIVNSPTFTVMNQYTGKNFKINHVDAYRLGSVDESEMYLENFFDSFNVIEWSQNLCLDLTRYFKVIEIEIKVIDLTTREFSIKELN